MKARGRFSQVFVARFRAGDSIAFEVRFRPELVIYGTRNCSKCWLRQVATAVPLPTCVASPRRLGGMADTPEGVIQGRTLASSLNRAIAYIHEER